MLDVDRLWAATKGLVVSGFLPLGCRWGLVVHGSIWVVPGMSLGVIVIKPIVCSLLSTPWISLGITLYSPLKSLQNSHQVSTLMHNVYMLIHYFSSQLVSEMSMTSWHLWRVFLCVLFTDWGTHMKFEEWIIWLPCPIWEIPEPIDSLPSGSDVWPWRRLHRHQTL